MADPQHNVSISVGGKVIEKWTDYGIESDMLKPADSFHMQIRNPTWETWTLCAPDSAVTVMIDGNVIMNGFIDDRHKNDDEGGGCSLYISGRDKGGRLVDESAPLASYEGLDVKALATRLCQPWFPNIVFTNDLNREAMQGLNKRIKLAEANHSSSPGHRARKRSHKTTTPIYPHLDYDGETRVTRKKVMAGEKRWQVLRSFLEELGLIGWSAADGESFIIGQPDYQQDLSYFFALPTTADARRYYGGQAGVISSSLRDSLAECYSQITAVGLGAGDFNVNVIGRAYDNPDNTAGFGVGKFFKQPKRLLVPDDRLRTNDSAAVRAKRELAERAAHRRHLQLRVRGHGQNGLLFAPDTMAAYFDGLIDFYAEFLITTVVFDHSDSQGETTMLHLVPTGTVLRI